MTTTPHIQAIETEYAGHRFRSRLEARWAVAFDTLGITWQYEPEGIDVDGIRYLPDFVLPGRLCRAQAVTVEVKGPLTRSDLRKILTLAAAGRPVLLLQDIPRPDEHGPHHVLFRRRAGVGGVEMFNVGFYPSADGWELLPFGFPLRIGDVADKQMLDQLLDLLVDRGPDRWVLVPAELRDAYRVARRARFEHGESPECRAPALGRPPSPGALSLS